MQELESLQNIFKDRIFKIPDYQRGYAWTKKHLKDFWEDLVNLPADRMHYTGVLSFSHSEIEVSTYDEWNAATILERGITLLEFMERRWDIKFENEAVMADLLFLEFMYAEEEVEEVGEGSNSVGEEN